MYKPSLYPRYIQHNAVLRLYVYDSQANNIYMPFTTTFPRETNSGGASNDLTLPAKIKIGAFAVEIKTRLRRLSMMCN